MRILLTQFFDPALDPWRHHAVGCVHRTPLCFVTLINLFSTQAYGHKSTSMGLVYRYLLVWNNNSVNMQQKKNINNLGEDKK
jgi:hypothetical protein